MMMAFKRRKRKSRRRRKRRRRRKKPQRIHLPKAVILQVLEMWEGEEDK